MCQSTPIPIITTSPLPLPPPDLIKQSKKRTVRLKFWEINSRYHCAALGTCLTLNELRQTGKKADIKNINTWSDYEIHVSFIHALDDKCYISTLVNKLLDKKYKLNILSFSKTKTEQDRIDLWQKAVVTGDITGAFWAILTHPDTSENTLFQIYGKVHMLSHLSGATARIDMKEFYQLDRKNNSLEMQINKNEVIYNKKIAKKETQLSNMEIQLSELQARNKLLQSAQHELEAIKKTPLVENLQNRLKKISFEMENSHTTRERAESAEEKWKQRAIREQEEKQQLQYQLKHLHDEKISLEVTLESLLENQQDHKIDCDSCPNSNPDLCGRCVLYIGGRGSQYSHFRLLVEKQNGKFIHHDGGREDGHQKLASIVSKADVVLCPLDCVSHTAMNAVKRHCQNNTKQLVFIPHASLSAFSKGLDEVIN